MTPEEYQWHVNLVRDRYKYLNLSYEQAEKVYKYEQDKNTNSEKYFFSQWEEWDYELTTFREILDMEQISMYERSLKTNIYRYEQSLAEHDSEKTNEIGYHEDLINFYETQFLPDLFKDPFFLFGRLSSDKAKIDLLKSEYQHFLNDTKKSILTSHFRHYRSFKPNELKTSLLRHKLSCVFPNYFSFKHQMDEPTKAVAHYLMNRLQYLPRETKELVVRKFKELILFSEANCKKHYGNREDWHTFGKLTPEEKAESRTMTLLLLNKEKYGC